MKIDAKTPAIDLWRILWTARGVHADLLTVQQRQARVEWDSRLEMREHEEGADTGHALAEQFDAYVQGREDELAIRGDDIDVARRLFVALGQARQHANPGGASERILVEALASLTLRERLRLEGRA